MYDRERERQRDRERETERERKRYRKWEHLLRLKSIVGAPVVQVMAHTTYNKRQDLHLCQSLLEARRLIGAEERRPMRKQTDYEYHSRISYSLVLLNCEEYIR